jgi:3-O-methylgallate 3,4-dioxygenase
MARRWREGDGMARIVLGLGTSHGPMLVTPPDQWGQRVEADRRNHAHPFRGKTYSFDELAAHRAKENFAPQITLDVWKRRHAECKAAIDKLADVLEEVKPDVAVIVGNDQKEMFNDSNNPAFAVYTGETIENRMGPEEHQANLEPGVGIAQPGRIPPEGATYEGCPDLANHIASKLTADRFDVATVTRLRDGRAAIPHAFGFVYRQVMRDRVIPNVPVMVNTFYPPNQPTIGRCYEFGKSLRGAIESWPKDMRVALIASGGLSHFVIDEEVDNSILDAMRERSIASVEKFGEEIFQSGTSEIKNWVPVAGVMADLGLELNIVDYVPCYRSLAGTGNAMGFVYWR